MSTRPLNPAFVETALTRTARSRVASRVAAVALLLLAAALLALPVAAHLDRSAATAAGAVVTAPAASVAPVTIAYAGDVVTVHGSTAAVGEDVTVTIDPSDPTRGWITDATSVPGRGELFLRTTTLLGATAALAAAAFTGTARYPSVRSHRVHVGTLTAARVTRVTRDTRVGHTRLEVTTAGGVAVEGVTSRGRWQVGRPVTLLTDPARERGNVALAWMSAGGPRMVELLPPSPSRVGSDADRD